MGVYCTTEPIEKPTLMSCRIKNKQLKVFFRYDRKCSIDENILAEIAPKNFKNVPAVSIDDGSSRIWVTLESSIKIS